MNIVTISGEIVTKVNFKFIYNRYGNKNKHISVAKCMLKLDNESIVTIYGYDNIADYMYRKLNKGENIFFEGWIDYDGLIEIKSVFTTI